MLITRDQFKYWVSILKPYVRIKNSNLVQRGIRVIGSEDGTSVSLRATNGSATINLTVPISSPGDIDYCVDWKPILGLSQTTREKEIGFQIFKSGIRIKTNDSNLKLESRPSRGFAHNVPDPSTPKLTYKGELDSSLFKFLSISSKANKLEPESGIMTLSPTHAYTFRQVSMAFVGAPLVDSTCYVQFSDFSPLALAKGEGSVCVYSEDLALTVVHKDNWWVRMPKVTLQEDLAGSLEKVRLSLKPDHMVEVSRKVLNECATRVRKAYGNRNVWFEVRKEEVAIVVDEAENAGSAAHTETVPAISDGYQCRAGLPIDLLYDLSRAIPGDKMTFYIPTLKEPARFLVAGNGTCTQLVSLDPENLLCEVK